MPLRVAACVFSAAPCDHQGFKLIDERRGCGSSLSAAPAHILVLARIILRFAIAYAIALRFLLLLLALRKNLRTRFKEAYGRTLKRSYSSLSIMATGEPEAPRAAAVTRASRPRPRSPLRNDSAASSSTGAAIVRPKRALLATRR